MRFWAALKGLSQRSFVDFHGVSISPEPMSSSGRTATNAASISRLTPHALADFGQVPAIPAHESG
jgi:hypothetical protein